MRNNGGKLFFLERGVGGGITIIMGKRCQLTKMNVTFFVRNEVLNSAFEFSTDEKYLEYEKLTASS